MLSVLGVVLPIFALIFAGWAIRRLGVLSDHATGEMALDLLDRLVRAQGRTLIVVTHSAEVARRADRVVHLDDGRLTAEA